MHLSAAERQGGSKLQPTETVAYLSIRLSSHEVLPMTYMPVLRSHMSGADVHTDWSACVWHVHQLHHVMSCLLL